MSGYFDHIDPIKYEGPDSTNDLAFKYYDPKKVIMGKTMEDHFCFGVRRICSPIRATCLAPRQTLIPMSSPLARCK